MVGAIKVLKLDTQPNVGLYEICVTAFLSSLILAVMLSQQL